MKKILLVLLSIGITTFAMANSNWFIEKKNAKKTIQNSINSKRNYFIPNNSLEAVPTLSKSSKWSEFNSVWLGQSAEETIYLYNKRSVIYDFDYTKSDTEGRAIFTYNSDNLISEFLYENYYSGIGYIPLNRYKVIYSNSNLKSVTTDERYNSQTNTWEVAEKTTHEIINNGETERYYTELMINGIWTVIDGGSFTQRKLNSTSEKITDYIDSNVNRNTGMFELEYMESRIYDANENVIEITYYGNDNGNTIITNVDSLFYTNNIPSSVVVYEPNAITNVLEKKTKYTNLVWLNYNPNKDIFDNNLIGLIGSIYINNNWELNDRYNLTYIDNYVSFIEQFDVHLGNTWQASEKYTILFNEKQYNIEYTYSTYDDLDSVWIINWGNKALVNYDNNSNISEIENESFDTNNNLWKKSYKYEYSNYITINTGINTSKNTLEVKLYPNPSADGKVSVNVNMEAASELSIKITDLKGSVIYNDLRNLGKGLNTVELSGLQQGLYLVELSTEYGVARTKLIVQ